MMKKLYALLVFLMIPVQAVSAQTVVDGITGEMRALPIAVPDFVTASDRETPVGLTRELGEGIATVINNNLESTGLFAPLDHRGFIQEITSAGMRPNFQNWRTVGSEALTVGGVELLADGNIQVVFRLYDVATARQIEGMSYKAPAASWRRIAHVISDKIYTRLTGDEGYFDTRIVYVAETGDPLNRIKRLAIMDQDGFNQQYMTDGSYMVLTPRFSPNRQEITYLSYFGGKPRVYLYNILSNKTEVLGDFDGMTFAPRFSPDGNKVIMSLARNGNSDVWVMDLRTRERKRLTNHSGIDTSPSYSPDGSQIVFNSDRGGSQQLYIMDADGENVRRISFGDGRYATPVWSPRGDLIAFTKIGNGKFTIGVMQTDGRRERLLTNAYQDEAPTWSPNGRVLMFFRKEPDRGQRRGTTTLWSVDITGYNERRVSTPFEASDPAWSPPLPIGGR